MPVSLILCDRSQDMVKAWRSAFPEESGVRVLNQNLLATPADALAIPANSFGYTDGGIDMAISREIFDWGLQERLRTIIDKQYHGELLVGQAIVMPTESARVHHVIVAPTMRIPEDISDTVNVYLAMRAILLAADEYNQSAASGQSIRTLAMPGLGAGVGKMPPVRAAQQMWMAYRSVAMGDREWMRSLEKQMVQHRKLREK